jgi:hypothetical protein
LRSFAVESLPPRRGDPRAVSPWSSSDTSGEAKKIEPQMNANGSVPNRPSKRSISFALARWRLRCER